MRLTEIFAYNLKTVRKRKQMTHEVLARHARLSKSYLSMLEHGARTPALETIEALARALRIDPLQLLDGAVTRHPGRALRGDRAPAPRRK